MTKRKKDDAITVMLEFQRWRGKSQPVSFKDADEDEDKREGWPDYALPMSVIELKDKLPDYQPGPVKHYTKTEIKEYEDES